MRIHMIGGPKDGRNYDYPEPLPNMLVFQHFDPVAHTVDYRRREHTHQYIYVEPS